MPDQHIIHSHTFSLPAENIDTDQIFPARFLTTTVRDGLGAHCFGDWRGNPKSRYYTYFQRRDAQRQQVLVSGDNFGCGSSREHAAWALLDAGFRAVISTRFGDIFRTNALNNGLLLIQVDAPTLAFLLAHDNQPVKIDIANAQLDVEGLETIRYPLDAFAAHCLIRGIDGLDFLLSKKAQISAFEAREEQ